MGETGVDLTYEAAGDGVLWEAFEDDVVVINLDTGCYYALDAVGGSVFDLLVGGLPVRDVAGRLALTYDGERDAMRSGIEAFTTRLVEAGLLRVREGDASVVDGILDVPTTKTPFTSPQIREYTDMQELLMLDPIHDVDETGWPARRDPGGT